MVGDPYLPKNRKESEKLPAIAFGAGTGGTKGGSGGRFGLMFAEKGYVAIAFDCRGWALAIAISWPSSLSRNWTR